MVLFGEQPVHGRQAAARRGVVDDVVVDQRAGLQQLERREQAQHVGTGHCVGRFDHRAPAPVGERGPHTFTAAQDELLDSCGQFGVHRTDVCAVTATFAQVLAQLFGDGAGQLDG